MVKRYKVGQSIRLEQCNRTQTCPLGIWSGRIISVKQKKKSDVLRVVDDFNPKKVNYRTIEVNTESGTYGVGQPLRGKQVITRVWR